MIESFITSNIQKLNHHLTMGFLENNGVYPTEDEAIVLTNFLKENYQDILHRQDQAFLILKGNIREEIYQKFTKIITDLRNQYL